ncbi:glutathione transferase GstA [Azospirillum rugosum]|uniref:Glutathione S-transferase n=1 Tax=Azospirillum rugosum TaxID=416170 RepID=A0ABS4SIK1_9PROT|nr:glutathione transferase GstA [Azospirillum rugosum]MBP2292397.1 glutathione S-transferase [Azospirillum rugosum]MDQ0526156.1 glutathione S-transferase [Azospirillum rugosum]
MKLYLKPGACSLSPHIVLRESGLAFDVAAVDLAAKTLEDGGDFLAVNPKGQVPTLALDEGGILTEGAAIVQYVADRAPDSGLLPAVGSLERYRVLEWLNFIGTELHKTFSPLFRPNTPDAFKDIVKQTLATKFAVVEAGLAGKDYLTGDRFTVADAYGFTVLRWAPRIGLPLDGYPNITAYMARVAERPAVAAALAAEGIA